MAVDKNMSVAQCCGHLSLALAMRCIRTSCFGIVWAHPSVFVSRFKKAKIYPAEIFVRLLFIA
jgi:hypothetical protein